VGNMSPPHIDKQMEGLGVEVHPWFMRFAPDRLAWVSLNSEPLRSHIPGPKPESRPLTRLPNGQLDWEWSVLPDYDLKTKPWRHFIPLRNEWMREGTQGWLFRKLNPTKLVEQHGSHGHHRIHPTLKSQVSYAAYNVTLCPCR